jgi:hypothetical protein
MINNGTVINQLIKLVNKYLVLEWFCINKID